MSVWRLLDSEAPHRRPLRHTDDVIDYRPTQFFATWAREHSYDGIRYTSAMTKNGSIWCYSILQSFGLLLCVSLAPRLWI